MHKRTTPKIFERAKRLHHEMTEPDAKLWSHLRAHRMGDVHFRNQHAISNYIVDICAPRTPALAGGAREKLIIELDGSQHLEQEEYDDERTSFMASKSYRVLRFWNNDVMRDIDSVLRIIFESVNEVEKE